MISGAVPLAYDHSAGISPVHSSGDLSPYRVLTLIDPEAPVSLSDLVNKVHHYLGSSFTEQDVKEALFDLVKIADLQLLHDFDHGYTAAHSEKSRSLYLDICGSILSPQNILLRAIHPSQGEKKDERCGTISAWVSCSANPDHHARPLFHNCNRKACPECYGYAIAEGVKKAESRIEAFYDKVYEYNQNKPKSKRLPLYRARHIGFNPPKEDIDRMVERAVQVVRSRGRADYLFEDLPGVFVDTFRGEINKRLEKSGLIGAAIKLHFVRIKDEYKEYAENLRDYLNNNLPAGKRKYNRYTALFSLDNSTEYFNFSPHAHLIAYGKIISLDDFIERTGWRYQNYDPGKKRKKNTSVGGYLHYLDSHTPIVEGKQGITYWGCLTPKYLKCIKSETKIDYEICPVCGSVLCHAQVDDAGRVVDLRPEDPYTHKVVLRTYELVRLHPSLREGVGDPPPGNQVREKAET